MSEESHDGTLTVSATGRKEPGRGLDGNEEDLDILRGNGRSK